jgi:CDP-diacylglycerol--glycerol-3-phosphate 3-phosphatidyltransferase
MNLPNFLTVIRMALVPVFIICFAGAAYLYDMTYVAGEGEWFEWGPEDYFYEGRAAAVLAFLIFGAASLTDAIDGYIARKRNMITNFGKLMDPLADKILTVSAFACFVSIDLIPVWMLIVIVAREFAITGLRGVAAAEGTVIAAGVSGKLKTVAQMVAVLLFLLYFVVLFCSWNVGISEYVLTAAQVVMWASLALTVWSGVEYLWKGRKLLNMK